MASRRPLEIRHPSNITSVRVHRPASVRRYGILAVFVALHGVCLQLCLRTSGEPYQIALEKVKAKNREYLGRPESERPPDEPLPWEHAPNEWAGAALFFSLSAHVLFFLLCHWRVSFRVAALYQPAHKVVEGTWFEVVPFRGQPTLVESWESSVTLRLCIEFQRQRYEFWELDDDSKNDDDSGSPAADGELKLMECPVGLPFTTYLESHGLKGEEVADLRHRYGSNILKVTTPGFWQCLREQMASPLVVFRLFIALLWAADDFLVHTVSSVFMIVMLESTSVLQRIQMLKSLNNMGTKPYDVQVYRDDCWMTASTSDLLPGDLVQLVLDKAEAPKQPDSILAAARPPQVSTTDVVPCDCVLLRGACVANEATISGESVPQMKDAVPSEARALDLENDRCHCLFSGSRIVRASDGDSIPADSEIPATPDGGCLCYVLRTGFYSSQGELLQVIEFSRESVTGDSKEIMVALAILTCFALLAAGYVLRRGLLEGEKTPHELIIKCIIILTSVVPRGLPMQMSLAVNTALMSLHSAGVFSTEPFRVPMAGKVTHCLFDKTGTLTTEELVPAGVVNLADSWSKGKVRDASVESSLVLSACQALVPDGLTLTGDPIEVAALKGIGWQYDPNENTARPGAWAELLEKATTCKEEAEKLAAQKDAAPTATEAKRLEARHEEKLKIAAAAEAAAAEERSRAEAIPVSSVHILHRFHFASRLQRMSVIVDVEAKEGTEEAAPRGKYALVKGSPEALGALFAEGSAPPWYETAYLELAEQGCRVLALALRQLDADADASKLSREEVERDLRFVGFIAFECQIRADSALVIDALKTAGHAVAMVTGDAPLTALHVAKNSCFADPAKPSLLLRCRGDEIPCWTVATGDRRGKPAPPGTTAELAQSFNLAVTEDALEASEDVWNDLGSISVFARMSPNGKAKVIRILQEHDGVVLMCGDGGNDAGALKQAEVGLALFAGQGATNTEEPVQSVGEGDSEKMLNERQLEIAKRAKDVQKLRAQFIKDKQKELQQEQMAWLQEEVDKRSEKGEIGVMAHMGAVKASLARYATEFSKATREFDKQNGNVYDKVDASPEAQMEKALAATPGQGVARPGDASVAAPFTSKTPSVKGCVDLLRQGRCTLLSSLQMQQVMMMNAIISAFVLSIISLEGSRRSERQLIASEWLLGIASMAFSYSSTNNRIHPTRPLRSLFHPAIFISMLGQAVIHLSCLALAVHLAREVMDENSASRQTGWTGPGLQDIKDFWKRQRQIRRGIIKEEEEELGWMEQAMAMWLSPFLPNLMNTVVFLVETAQTVAVLTVNYKGQPWMRGVLENRPLFFSVFVVVLGVGAVAWEVNPELNELVHLSPFPSDVFRWKVMGLVCLTIGGTFAWDRFCVLIFAPQHFRAMCESIWTTSFKDDVVPLFRSFFKACLVVCGLGALSYFSVSTPAVSVPGPLPGTAIM